MEKCFPVSGHRQYNESTSGKFWLESEPSARRNPDLRTDPKSDSGAPGEVGQGCEAEVQRDEGSAEKSSEQKIIKTWRNRIGR